MLEISLFYFLTSLVYNMFSLTKLLYLATEKADVPEPDSAENVQEETLLNR